jgi:hypothetical protein
MMLGDRNHDSGETSLSIPVGSRSLATFIATLLGQKRTIRYRAQNCKFYASYDWIINVINIIEQRMSQNIHELASFRGTIYFSDGRAHTVESIDAFRSFIDRSGNESVGVSLSISYLVSLPTKERPEMQDIMVHVFSDERFFFEASPSHEISQRQSLVEYTVEFTNLTFGTDISRHISSHIDNLLMKKGALLRLFEAPDGPPMIGAFFMIGGLAGLFYDIIELARVKITATELVQYQKVSGSDPFELIENKLDFFFNKWANQAFSLSWITYAGLCLFVIGTILLFLPRWRIIAWINRSYVVFNDHTRELLASHKKRRELVKWTVLIGGIIGILGGIISGRIDSLFFK